MQRILVISGDTKATGPHAQALLRAGYHVSTSASDETAVLEALTPRPPDVIVLHGPSSRVSTRRLRQILREEFPSADSLLLALLAEARIADFDVKAGVDDIALDSASTDEVLTRVKMALWRAHKVDPGAEVQLGSLTIDVANYSVYVNGGPIELTYKEYELLRFLATHRGRVFTREALLNQVWGYDYYGGTRTVDVHIRRIRAKLGPCDAMIETVRNVGYRFNESAGG
jgi:DNA-binding response OmpR family regulator